MRAEERHRRKGHWAGRDGAAKTSAAAQAHIPAPHLLLQRCERLAAVGFRGGVQREMMMMTRRRRKMNVLGLGAQLLGKKLLAHLPLQMS